MTPTRDVTPTRLARSFQRHAPLSTEATRPEAARPDAPPADVLAATTLLLRWLQQAAGGLPNLPTMPTLSNPSTPSNSAPSQPDPALTATHTPGFESVKWFGRTYHFTKKQRPAVAALWTAWRESVASDDPAAAAVHQAVLLEDANSTQLRLRDVFEQGRHPAWGTMIVLAVNHGTGKSGCYMLRPPAGAEEMDGPSAVVARRDETPPWTPARSPATECPPLAAASHSPDFAEVNWYGTDYRFDAGQRAAVALLWAAWASGTAAVPMADLLAATGTGHVHLRAVFDGGQHPAWGAMIEVATLTGGPKGCYLLQSPTSALPERRVPA